MAECKEEEARAVWRRREREREKAESEEADEGEKTAESPSRDTAEDRALAGAVGTNDQHVGPRSYGEG